MLFGCIPESDPAATFALLGGEERGGALLESALGLPRQPYYETIHDKAAVLMRSLMKNHPFMDGNKRTAVAATLVFLLVNELVLTVSQEELVEFCVSVARSDPAMDWEDIAKWLAPRTVSIRTLDEDERRQLREAHRNIDIEALKRRIETIRGALGDLPEA